MEITKLNINFTALRKDTLDSRLKTAAMTRGQTERTTPAYNLASKAAQTLRSEETAAEKPEPLLYKAFFAVDDNKNVVVKVVDSDGKVIRQIPPEDYIKMVEALKEITKNLFHTEA